MSSPPAEAPPLGKYLASSGMCILKFPGFLFLTSSLDKKTRDKAVKQLAIFLSNDESNAMPEIEMAKLWKGIFYCIV